MWFGVLYTSHRYSMANKVHVWVLFGSFFIYVLSDFSRFQNQATKRVLCQQIYEEPSVKTEWEIGFSYGYCKCMFVDFFKCVCRPQTQLVFIMEYGVVDSLTMQSNVFKSCVFYGVCLGGVCGGGNFSVIHGLDNFQKVRNMGLGQCWTILRCIVGYLFRNRIPRVI